MHPKKTHLILLFLFSLLSFNNYAFDETDDMPIDKADNNDLEGFHLDSGITLWKKNKAIVSHNDTNNNDSNNTVTKHFESGQKIDAREAYKLSNHPSLHNTSSLYQAIELLHAQLNQYCPNGWEKKSEWHLPAKDISERSVFYIHYRAVCL